MPVFETPGSVTLQLRIPTGRVSIETTDEPRTEIELVPRGRRGEEAIEQIDISHDEHAGRHVITVEQRDRIRWGPLQITWGSDVEVRVKCPVGSELDFSGASTELRAEGRYGKVSARTASGEIRLGEVEGKLEVKTASGDISLDRILSDTASVVTVSGDLELGHVEGRLTVRTVSGDVDLGVARGPVTISTTSGDVNLKSLEAGELRVQSVSGDARIGIARGTRIWIDATSVSGDMNSELTVGDDTPAEGSEGFEGAGEVVPLHVKTVSGDVQIVRSAAAVGG